MLAQPPPRVAVRPPYLAFGTPGALRATVGDLAAQPGWTRMDQALPVLLYPRLRVRAVAYPGATAVHQPVLDVTGHTRSGAVTWSAQLRTGIPDEALLAFRDALTALLDINPPHPEGDHPARDLLLNAGWTPYLDALDPDEQTCGVGSPDGMADFAHPITSPDDPDPQFWRFSAGVPGQMWSASLSRDAPVPLVTALAQAMATTAPAIRDRAGLRPPLPDLAPYLHLTTPAPGDRVVAATAHGTAPTRAAAPAAAVRPPPPPRPAVIHRH